MNELRTRGVVVIPLPQEIFNKFNMTQFLNEQREYKVSNESTTFVMGAFGALPLVLKCFPHIHEKNAICCFLNCFNNNK